MKILQYIRIYYTKNNITLISHCDTSRGLRYVHIRYMKCFFTNINKVAYFLRNLQTLRANNWRNLRIQNAKFSGNCLNEHKHTDRFSNLH